MMWKGLLLAVVLIVFLLSLLTGVTTIEPGERAVVTRFGRILDWKPEPGLYIGLPWGIDRVTKVKVDARRSVKIGFEPEAEIDFDAGTPVGQMLTGDHNLVNIQAVIVYNIREGEVERFVFQQQRAETLVARTAETVLSEWAAGRTYDTVIKKGQHKKGAPAEKTLRSWLVDETQKRIERYEIGVEVEDASIKVLTPAEVERAYVDVSRAERQIKTEKNRAFQERERKLQTARTEEHELFSQARAYAEEQKNAAMADVANFEKRLAQYRLLKKDNPYYLNAVWWDEMSRLYAGMKSQGRIDLLDHHLGTNGLDITTMPPLPKNR